jgi:hypothetical protein
MSNYMLSAEAYTHMRLHNQWIAREAPKRGLKDPWVNRPDRMIDTEEILMRITGTDTDVKATKSIYREATAAEVDEWKIYRDSYIRQRDEWIALQMFQKYGYETFLENCEMCRLTEEFKNSVIPCESQGEAQCNLYCPKWDVCDRR